VHGQQIFSLVLVTDEIVGIFRRDFFVCFWKVDFAIYLGRAIRYVEITARKKLYLQFK
jgi:hypothetical protein